MKAAIYARVSTTDQDCGMQLRELRAFAERSGWAVFREYVDMVSGAKASRPQLDALMADARLRHFDAVVCWKLDRWGRSLVACLNSIEELDRLGVRLIVPGQNIDTDKNSPVGRLLMPILGAVGQFERELIRERVVAGVRAAQAKGKHCGRAKKVFRRDLVVEMRKQGKSWRQIGRELGIPQSTARLAYANLADDAVKAPLRS